MYGVDLVEIIKWMIEVLKEFDCSFEEIFYLVFDVIKFV